MAIIRQIKLFYRIMKYRIGVARVSRGCREGVAKCMKQGSRTMDHGKTEICDTSATPLRPLCDRGGVAAISYIYQCL